MTDHPYDDPKQLWREQPLEETTMSLAEIHNRIDRLALQVRRRNLIGGLACLIVLLSFSFFAVIFPNPMQRTGSMLTVAASLFLMYQLIRRKMYPRRGQPLARQSDGLTFYRSELIRQRDFHRGWWFWSRFVALAPGPAIFCVGFARAYPSLAVYFVLEALIFVALLIVAIPLNLSAAKRYQRELDTLESLNG
jgi:hypothetical protein